MPLPSITNSEKIVKLLEINKLLTKSLDITTVLQTLVQAAADLTDVSDTIILYLYDPVDRVLKMAEAVGVDVEIMKNIAFAPGESLTGKAFIEKKSLLFAHRDEINANMATMTERNYTYYFQGVYQRHVRSAFCVPLIYQEKCLGVLVVDNFENDGFFTEDDMKVIEIIADQSAIAIVHSDLFQTLKEKNNQLEHSLDIHHKFTKIILEGGGIKTILFLLSRILQTKVNFQEWNAAKTDSHTYSIIRGKEVLGYIQLEKQVSTLTSLEMVALEHAGTAIAMELMKENALYEKELHFREEVFQQMIEGASLEELKRMVKQYSWDLNGMFACIVMEGKTSPLWKSTVVMDKERFVKSIEQLSQSISQSSFTFTKAYQTIIVTPIVTEDMLDKIAQSIDRRWGGKLDIVYGFGRSVSIRHLRDSYREALEAVRYGKTALHEKFINYSKLGAERLWQQVDRTVLEYYVQDKLKPLLLMEPDYIDTLGNFIECNRNHKLTAEKLHIHPNTLYHRLKKIERALHISFEHETDWVNVVLAYRIYVSIHNV